MTDSRTTELLPCPWCGVDMKLHAINYPWSDGDPGWNIWHEDMGEAGKRKCPMEMGCYDTKEEAITAWNTRAELGSEPPYDELLRCIENDWHIKASWDGLRKFWCIELTEEGAKLRDATHGTLTAEQVRECAERVYFEGYSDGSVNRGAHIEETDWQAIADELNAKLGSGTCKLEPLSALDVTLNMLDQTEWGACSECGCAVPMDARFCNECGKAVKR